MDEANLVSDSGVEPVAAHTVTILYFARLKEVFGRGLERIALPGSVGTVEALREHLRARGGPWEAELALTKPVRVAVNQEMAGPEARVGPNDEVAFFPPVTGG
jgi:molybdopterin synthase sulfur carrier subunit